MLSWIKDLAESSRYIDHKQPLFDNLLDRQFDVDARDRVMEMYFRDYQDQLSSSLWINNELQKAEWDSGGQAAMWQIPIHGASQSLRCSTWPTWLNFIW
jgi:hypothetical protein